ncbi:MAG: alpha/beta fold hydrolase [Sphingopyxis sp.]|uniref:alpha/beta fold hydrolase n=1 Tax=Sphingopyxis TaxID=165697 RepID=UPI00285ABB0F|nr:MULTISPECIES: alpha/beta hydrolase [unclassified Sphingopyxis]MDR7060379.1 pimeloyl-ACP methyl ester carboxylesterase [Sphingopyxis sp. BE235]MDR7180108.1 pimeloyl-ACP methyl ester carboxylesterase [Sphingopyxis sp. BE249]
MAQQDAKQDGHRDWSDHYWWSSDGVRLHARVYAGPEGSESAPPLLCMPGLARNARDFEDLAPHLAQYRKVIVIEFRGRGESAFAKDPMTYVPLTYVQDVVAMLDELGIERFAAIGTSLGGLVAMLLAAALPGRLVGAVLNDVGPELQTAGLERIRDYIGAGGSQPTWMHAARAFAELNGAVYPGYEIHDWLRLTKRTHRLTAEGRIVTDYDKQIAAPLRVPGGGDAAMDLWPIYRALGDVPLLILRGELSDILARSAGEKMVAELPRARLVEVPGVGHAPTMDEPAARAAIDAWAAELPAA